MMNLNSQNVQYNVHAAKQNKQKAISYWEFSKSGGQILNTLAYKTRFHLIFMFPAWSKRNIILTVTAQSNQFLHSKAINKHFSDGNPLRIWTPEISIENVLELISLCFRCRMVYKWSR